MQPKRNATQKTKARIFGEASLAAALFAAALTASPQASASVSGDLDALGGNDAVVKRAAKLSSKNDVAIVQGRTVDRNMRFEFLGAYGPLAGGSSSLSTQLATAQAEFHVVPQFSLGVRYAKAFSQLTNEGQAAYDALRAQKASGGVGASAPDVDAPQSSVIGTATWYMFYGKINFFDVRVIQFDIYSLAGYGSMTTQNSSSPAITAGGGIAFWIAQHVTSRFEIRYLGYKDKVYTGERDQNAVVGTAGFGFLL